jgi:Fur family peroxide stress response transcriptional regulator
VLTPPSTKNLVNNLKKAGLRVTPQRLAIYRCLVSSDDHPTAQTLFEQLQHTLPSLSRATVYNTLQALEHHGLVQKIGEAGDGAVHYDANATPHINLVCTRCHRVEDFWDASLEGVGERVVSRSGYRVHSMRVAYYGLCPRCQVHESADQSTGKTEKS